MCSGTGLRAAAACVRLYLQMFAIGPLVLASSWAWLMLLVAFVFASSAPLLDECGQLNPDHTPHMLAEVMRACGVVGLQDALPRELIADLSVAVDSLMVPILESRETMCRILTAAEKANVSDAEVWEHYEHSLSSEPLVTAYTDYHERSAGRIDFALPWRSPFDDSALVANSRVLPLLHNILGPGVELKALRVVYALPDAPAQSFHRDGGHLFPEVEARDQPPYAANLFIPLIDMDDADAGPTEFEFGSHKHARDVNAQIGPLGAFRAAAGTAVVSDYRVVHRGLAHSLERPRPIVMLIYGRSWWEDRDNYEKFEYMKAVETRAFERALKEKQCYGGEKDKVLLLRRHHAAGATLRERLRASFDRFVHDTFKQGGCELE